MSALNIHTAEGRVSDSHASWTYRPALIVSHFVVCWQELVNLQIDRPACQQFSSAIRILGLVLSF